MRQFWLRMAAGFTGLTVTATAGAAGTLAPMTGSMPPPRVVLTRTEAFMLLPPELVAAPTVSTLSFSPGGRYLLAERIRMRVTAELIREARGREEPPPGELSLILWDSRARASREVWHASLNGTTIQRIGWMPQTDIALALVSERQGPESRQTLLRMSGAADRAQSIPLSGTSDADTYDLTFSPSQPLALLHQTSMVSRPWVRPDGRSEVLIEPRETFTLWGRSGQPGRKITLPDEMRLRLLEWSGDGTPVLNLFSVPTAKSDPSDRWYAVDPQTAALRPLPKPPAFYASKAPAENDQVGPSPLRVKLAASSAREGDSTQSVGLLWLETSDQSEKPRALVCGDSAGGQLLPNGEGVIYFSQGAVLMAPLLRMSREENQAMIDSARRAAAISRAKQVGLGLSMYAQDYDGALPAAEELHSRLLPYLKDASLLEGFIFTYLGGKMNDIQNPAETEMGYVSAPGGREVLYADGHVMLKKE